MRVRSASAALAALVFIGVGVGCTTTPQVGTTSPYVGYTTQDAAGHYFGYFTTCVLQPTYGVVVDHPGGGIPGPLGTTVTISDDSGTSHTTTLESYSQKASAYFWNPGCFTVLIVQPVTEGKPNGGTFRTQFQVTWG